MVTLERELPGHVEAREALLDECFGPSRFTRTCERLRRGRTPADGLAFAAMDDGRLVGTLRLWHIRAGSAGSSLLLGPLGVSPDRRGQNIGILMVDHALDEAMRLGHRSVLLVGDAPYYGRFGFSERFTGDLLLPGPVDRHRFLGRELAHDALDGARGMVSSLDRIPAAARATAQPLAVDGLSHSVPSVRLG